MCKMIYTPFIWNAVWALWIVVLGGKILMDWRHLSHYRVMDLSKDSLSHYTVLKRKWYGFFQTVKWLGQLRLRCVNPSIHLGLLFTSKQESKSAHDKLSFMALLHSPTARGHSTCRRWNYYWPGSTCKTIPRKLFWEYMWLNRAE